MIRLSVNDTCCKDWSAYPRSLEKGSRGSWFWMDEFVATYSLASMEVLFGSSLVLDHVASPRYTDVWIAGYLSQHSFLRHGCKTSHLFRMDFLDPYFGNESASDLLHRQEGFTKPLFQSFTVTDFDLKSKGIV